MKKINAKDEDRKSDDVGGVFLVGMVTLKTKTKAKRRGEVVLSACIDPRRRQVIPG